MPCHGGRLLCEAALPGLLPLLQTARNSLAGACVHSAPHLANGHTNFAAAAVTPFCVSPRLLLVDACSIIHRVYHRLHKDYIHPRPGLPSLVSRLVLEVAKDIGSYVDQLQPSHMAVCFDPPGKNWRCVLQTPCAIPFILFLRRVQL